MAADGSDLRQVAAFYEVVLTEPRNETVFVNTDIEAGPTWSPDGQVLAFAVVEFERVPDEHEASLSDEVRHNVLYSVRTDGSNLTRLLDMPEGSAVETLGWSPDGKIAITYKYREEPRTRYIPTGRISFSNPISTCPGHPTAPRFCSSWKDQHMLPTLTVRTVAS